MYTSIASIALLFVAGAPQERNTQNADCTSLPDPSMFVDFVANDGTPATPTGGTVTDGTYVLTGAQIYGSGAPAGFVFGTFALTYVITAGTFEGVNMQRICLALGGAPGCHLSVVRFA